MTLRVMISAAEASADRLGAALLRALSVRTEVDAAGMGGPRLRAAGLTAWRDASELSVVGLFEVVRHLPRLYALHRDLVRRAAAAPPAVAVLIDAPDFHLRVARGLRRLGVPVVLFVPPAVWASRPGRAERYAAVADAILVLFPFEVAAWPGASVACVGHPLVDEIPAPARPPAGAPKRVALLPGSRPVELARHLPVLAGAAARLWRAQRARDFVVPLADPGHRARVQAAFERLPVELVEGPGAARTAVAGAAAALVASGTATLETALLGCPQVVFYRLHPATYAVARRVMTVPCWALPNLLVGRPAVPERIQGRATAADLAAALSEVLDRGPGIALDLADEVRARLGPPGAADRAADAVLAVAGARHLATRNA